MPEGLQFAGGGSSGPSQTGTIQQGYAPPRGTAGQLFGPGSPVALPAGVTALTSEQMLRWNATTSEWEVTPAAVSALVALVNGAKLEGTAEGRTENFGHMGRLKGTLTVKAAEELVAGETLATLPVALRPEKAETLPWAIAGSGAYIEVKIATSGVITLSANLKAAEAINLTGLEYFVS